MSFPLQWNLSLGGERISVNVTGLQAADGTPSTGTASNTASVQVFKQPADAARTIVLPSLPGSGNENETVTLLSLVTTDRHQRLLPAVTQTSVGQGSVVVIHPPLAADIDRLGLLDWVLDNVTDGLTPFSFTGGEAQTLTQSSIYRMERDPDQ